MTGFKYCARLDGTNHVVWAYTLEGIRESVRMAAYMGNWRIFALHEIR